MKGIRNGLIIIVLGFMLALIIYPDRYIESVSYGLRLFTITVLPALFPFFFFSKILTSLDVASSMEKALKKPLKKLFNSPPVAGYILIISLLSGYPIGAKLIADCYNMGIISKSEAKNISVFTSTSGPLFIVGSVGINMMGNKTAGFIMLFSHYLGAIINGLILVNRQKSTDNNKEMIKKRVDYDNILSDSITSSILSVAVVGGYIAIFCMLVDVLNDFKILPFFEKIFTVLRMPKALANGVVTGIVEITRGCKVLSDSGYSMKAIVPIAAGIISFGGMSITLQSLTFASQCKIKPLFYLKTKFSQGIITFSIATILCLIFF